MARILMYSGGIDSFILKKLYSFEDRECLFINLGTKENKIEQTKIQRYFSDTRIVSFNLKSFELTNHIIPFRNNLFSLIAGQFASDIYFAFTAGDTTKDKDYVFKSQMEGILNYFGQDVQKIPKNIQIPYSIHMPFKQFSKTQLIEEYLKQGFDISELIEKSNSCYNGTKKPCGKCRACVRNYVALENNGINTTNMFLNNPREQLHIVYNESVKKNRKSEIKDIEKCINQKKQY